MNNFMVCHIFFFSNRNVANVPDRQTNEPRTKKYYTEILTLKEIKFETAAQTEKSCCEMSH